MVETGRLLSRTPRIRHASARNPAAGHKSQSCLIPALHRPDYRIGMSLLPRRPGSVRGRGILQPPSPFRGQAFRTGPTFPAGGCVFPYLSGKVVRAATPDTGFQTGLSPISPSRPACRPFFLSFLGICRAQQDPSRTAAARTGPGAWCFDGCTMTAHFMSAASGKLPRG